MAPSPVKDRSVLARRSIFGLMEVLDVMERLTVCQWHASTLGARGLRIPRCSSVNPEA